jgi:CBS-domain-containing membrane protein
MRAHEIMSREVITVGVDASIVDAINIMLAHHIGGLPVVDPAGKLVGILSEGDFIRCAEIGTQRRRGRWLTLLAGADRVALDLAREHGRKVGQLMTANPVTITDDTPLEQVVGIMESPRRQASSGHARRRNRRDDHTCRLPASNRQPCTPPANPLQ